MLLRQLIPMLPTCQDTLLQDILTPLPTLYHLSQFHPTLMPCLWNTRQHCILRSTFQSRLTLLMQLVME